MPAIEVTTPMQVEEPKNEEENYKTPVIGIIYPPPEVRNIVDKTASFVARNGPEFESRIRQNEQNNSKFNFLNPADPYHAYYQHKVKEFREGKGQEPQVPKGQGLGLSKPLEVAKIIQEPVIPTEPPPEFEFIADPPSISAFDLDVVRLTAQFVARNGRQFLTNLMNREQRNYQFDFLRPQHSLFNYFTKLVEQYTKVLIPPKDLLVKLNKESEVYQNVLDQVKYRVDWARYQEMQRRKEEEAAERERVAYTQIDWHDFVVVETVDFQPNEQGNLPPPTTPDEVGARVLAQERHGKRGTEDEMDVESGESESEDEDSDEEDEEEEVQRMTNRPPMPTQMMEDSDESSDEDEEDQDKDRQEIRPQQRMPQRPPPVPAMPPPPPPSEIPQPPLPPTPDQVVIKKGYDPKARTIQPEAPSEQFLVSPITGEKIPVDKVQQHMKIGLLDPKWIEERNRQIQERTDQEEVFAAGSSIESSLKHLAERRTDIFGAGTEEAGIGKKLGEEEDEGKKDKKVVWDGHTASMEKVAQKARENFSIDEQIANIHKVKGLVPDAEKEKIGPSRTMGMAIPPPPPPSKPAPPKPAPPKQPPPPAVSMPGPPVSTQPQALKRPVVAIQQPPPPQVMMMPPRPPPMQVIGMPPGPPSMMVAQPMRPPGFPAPPPMVRPPAPVPQAAPPEDEPPSKKQKTEEQLVPEEEWLKLHKGSVKFRVTVPSMPDKPEFNLKGQTLQFTLPYTDNVSVLKAKINESVGLPGGKQKLQYDGLFIKDSNTLAFYNFVNGGTVQLQLKERGGRKK
ncbi:splicing factor 3A subunit 1-like [Ruditapes philippinarum]|uniref:splicing factor 3A subunit 1-like n=1 Tax=Ruditapes philippinarum TaxID=129788 RepID=UPI00295B55C0|nr:splicing factor 3A subunit 1-like [Ruditapes philippinarum]